MLDAASISRDPFFARVARRPVSTSAGPCDLPILYSDASLLGLVYRVDAGRARDLVDPAFEPWIVFGKALAMVCAFDYRETTIGPYGELGIGLLVKRRGARPSLLGALADLRRERDAGLYIVNLPVTTKAARSAGRELWGFPKYETPMEASFKDEGVRFGLGKELTIRMGPSRGIRTPGMPFVLYSVNGGRILRTVVEVDHEVRWGGAPTATIAVNGDGPSAATVRALGLDRAKALAAFRTDGMRSILPLGEDMGAAPNGATKKAAAFEDTLRTGVAHHGGLS
jgi:hypothetical protein